MPKMFRILIKMFNILRLLCILTIWRRKSTSLQKFYYLTKRKFKKVVEKKEQTICWKEGLKEGKQY